MLHHLPLHLKVTARTLVYTLDYDRWRKIIGGVQNSHSPFDYTFPKSLKIKGHKLKVYFILFYFSRFILIAKVPETEDKFIFSIKEINISAHCSDLSIFKLTCSESCKSIVSNN